MLITFDVIKILAVGTEKRYMWIKYNDKYMGQTTKCVYINEPIYQRLKALGVPTSQQMSAKNRKNNEVKNEN